MSFVKNTWKYGDKISSDDLNRIEDGVEEAQSCVIFLETYESNGDIYISASYMDLLNWSESKYIALSIESSEENEIIKTINPLTKLLSDNSEYHAQFLLVDYYFSAEDDTVPMKLGGKPK